MAYEVGDVSCADKHCNKTIKNHRWGKIKADQWFHQKDGTSWCPDHIPEWVTEWRAKRAAGVPPEPWRKGNGNTRST